jgi:flagellar basal body-associated protein FliL
VRTTNEREPKEERMGILWTILVVVAVVAVLTWLLRRT